MHHRSHRRAIVVVLAALALAGACSSDDEPAEEAKTNDTPAAHEFCRLAVDQVKAIQSDLIKLATGGPVDPAFIAAAKAANEKLLTAAPDDIRADAQTMVNVSLAAQESAAKGESADVALTAMRSPEFTGAVTRYSAWVRKNCSEELATVTDSTSTSSIGSDSDTGGGSAPASTSTTVP